MNTILQKRIEEAAKIYAESEVNRMDDSTYSMHEKKRLKMFDGYDIEEALIRFSEQILQNQWISVEEALPTLDEKYDFSERYIVKTNEGAIKVMRIFKNIAWCDIFNRRAFIPFEKKIVTHWMKIPNEGGEE